MCIYIYIKGEGTDERTSGRTTQSRIAIIQTQVAWWKSGKFLLAAVHVSEGDNIFIVELFI